VADETLAGVEKHGTALAKRRHRQARDRERIGTTLRHRGRWKE
jgi:hypothetical protein